MVTVLAWAFLLSGATGSPPSGAASPARAQLLSDPVSRPAVATGLPSGTLYSWGSNDWGQLAVGASGGGTPTPEAVPATVVPPSGTTFRSVAAGGAFSVGLTANGGVYAWGADFSGQLGVGSLAAVDTPQPVAVPNGPVVAVAAGSSQALALTASGTVYAWGANSLGQVGDGTTTPASTPQPVAMPPGITVTAIAAGGDHSLALTSSGEVYAWGANFDGQLGDGTTDSRPAPVLADAPPSTAFTAIAAGTADSLALSSSGQVYAWGANAAGQLGNGSTANSATMTAVHLPGGVSVTRIASGSAHNLALTSTGHILAWGSNIFGQLDSALVGSLPVESAVPIQPLGLPPLTTFVAISGGVDSSYALTSAGVAWVWGGNAYGQLGVGAPGLDEVLPVPLSALPSGTLATGLFSGADASSAFLITRSEQSLSRPALPRSTYGDPPVDLAVTSSSGLAVSAHASGSCSGPPDRLRLVAAGVCRLTLTQSGNFWFYPATASAAFVVARATLTIEAVDRTATVGLLSSPLGYRLSGFRNRDPGSVVSGRASCSSPATDASPPGTYPITCQSGTLSATDYQFLSGGPGLLTLTAEPSGYALVGADGSVWALGPAQADTAPGAPFYGSMAGHPLDAPVVGTAFTPRHDGYWLVASDGGIFSFGAARFDGSMGGAPLNRPIVGIASTPNGAGYWEVASDGGIFAFGDAPFFGSTGDLTLNQPIVGMAATPDGRGYWLVASDGGIFAFGDAPFFGSTGGLNLGGAVVGMATTASGDGYWITTASGAVFAFGHAPFEGSLRYVELSASVVGITASYDGQGYWLATSDGGIFAFGNARYYGRATPSAAPIRAIT